MDGMMKMFLDEDPELFDIEKCKANGLWPKEYLASNELIPYVKRLRGPIIGIQIGIFKGETTYTLLEECPNIEFMYGVDLFDSKLEKEIAEKNLADFVYKGRYSSDPIYLMSMPYMLDFIFINTDRNFKYTLEKYFPRLKKGGIIAGSSYEKKEIRIAISEFRREHHAMMPINVTKMNNAWFWYK